ncbi:MAG TPA: hypothetical protein DD643_06700 [Synechococcus sp. UBA8638]|nr:hypothetical protein [Synechococcus sp. UBA8638]
MGNAARNNVLDFGNILPTIDPMKTSLASFTLLCLSLGLGMAFPTKAWAEHPLLESAREMQAELERLGFTSDEALVEDFLQWRRQQRQNRQNQDLAVTFDAKDVNSPTWHNQVSHLHPW